MRDELAADAALAWKLAFRREEDRREALVEERAALHLRLEALEKKLCWLLRGCMRFSRCAPKTFRHSKNMKIPLAFSQISTLVEESITAAQTEVLLPAPLAARRLNDVFTEEEQEALRRLQRLTHALQPSLPWRFMQAVGVAKEHMELIDELMGVLNAHPELPLYERAVLKLAVSLLDQKKHRYSEHHNWHVRLTLEESMLFRESIGKSETASRLPSSCGCTSDVPAIDAAKSFCSKSEYRVPKRYPQIARPERLGRDVREGWMGPGATPRLQAGLLKYLRKRRASEHLEGRYGKPYWNDRWPGFPFLWANDRQFIRSGLQVGGFKDAEDTTRRILGTTVFVSSMGILHSEEPRDTWTGFEQQCSGRVRKRRIAHVTLQRRFVSLDQTNGTGYSGRNAGPGW
jgi:hypothetical protein